MLLVEMASRIGGYARPLPSAVPSLAVRSCGWPPHPRLFLLSFLGTRFPRAPSLLPSTISKYTRVLVPATSFQTRTREKCRGRPVKCHHETHLSRDPFATYEPNAVRNHCQSRVVMARGTKRVWWTTSGVRACKRGRPFFPCPRTPRFD